MNRKRLLGLFLSILLLFPSLSHGEERIRVAILPWEIHGSEGLDYLKDALYDLLSSRIGVEERIEVVDRASVERTMEGGEMDPLKIGRALGVDYVIIGSLSVIGGAVSIDVKALDTSDGTSMASLSQGKSLESLIPMVGRVALDIGGRMLKRRGYSPTVIGFGGSPVYRRSEEVPEEEGFILVLKGKGDTERIWRSRTFSGIFREAALGDVDGDGRNEIVLIDNHNLWIYRRVGETLDLLWKEEGVLTDEHLYVDVADMNGNGVAEIYVTRMVSGRLESYVLEYDGKGYRKIAVHIPYFLRVLPSQEGMVLLGQAGDGEEGFRGDVFRLGWSERGLKRLGYLDLPEGVNIFGFTYARIDGKEGVVSFDEKDHLVIHLREDGEWRRVWKSKGFYGGTINTMKLGPEGTRNPDAMRLEDIKGRILFMDLDGDGTGEIIVNRNISTLTRFVKGLKGYEKGEIVDLEWDGKGLEENWKTKTLNGYVGSPLIGDFDNDGGKDLVILLVEGAGTLSRSSSTTILSYSLIAK